MAGKVYIWSDEQAKKELAKRLNYAIKAKEQVTQDWRKNECAIFGTNRSSERTTVGNLNNGIDAEFGGELEADNSDADVTISYVFKNWRFLHAQLSSNPPTVLPRPATTDQDDRRKAESADKVVRHGLRHYRLQNYVDLASGNAVGAYGNGFVVVEWDPNAGEVVDVLEDGTVIMDGDISFRVPSSWNIFINPDATDCLNLGWYFERMILAYEDACFLYPDSAELFKQSLKSGDVSFNNQSAFSEDRQDVVELFVYWEDGKPVNGFLGRHGVCLKDGTCVQKVGPNPHRFKSSDSKNPKFEVARLPLKMFTDVDVPNSPWGMSSVSWAANIQDSMNRLDSLHLDNIQAHGVARLVLPESAEIADDSITNTPWDVMRITGNQPPFHMHPPTLMPSIDTQRAVYKTGIDDTMGVNENMFGQQSREQSALSMQTATNQGNLIRHRLFNKYTMWIEEIYNDYLDLVKKHWTTPKLIKVMGKGKALQAVELKGADIDGGYDLVVEYGTSFSLDPTIRKQEIAQMIPVYKEAGIPIKGLIKYLRMANTEGLEDIATLAEDRQREIFEEMISTGKPIQPRKNEDHANMLAYAAIYVMTEEYKYLEEQAKTLIDQHIDARAVMMAQSQQPQPSPGAPGAPGQPVPTPQGQPAAAPVNQSGQANGPALMVG